MILPCNMCNQSIDNSNVLLPRLYSQSNGTLIFSQSLFAEQVKECMEANSSPTDETSVSGAVASGWIIPIKIRERSERWNGKRGGGSKGMKITRCAGNDRKYKPGEISQAGNIPARHRSTNTRDCSTPSFTPRPSFFLSVAPAAASFLLRPERRGVKCSMPPNIRIARFPGISLYFVGIKA